MAEVIGVAASIVQLAGAGAKLSTALYNFVGSVARADQEIKNIAGDVQATVNALGSVGSVFKDEESKSIVSKGAIEEAKNIIQQCESVFEEIRELTEKRRKVKDGKRSLTTLGKFSWPLKEQRVQLIRGRLEALKSNLILLFHVLQLANDQSKRKLEKSALEEEREKIRQIHQHQQDSLKTLEALQSKLGKVCLDDGETLQGSITSSRAPTIELMTQTNAPDSQLKDTKDETTIDGTSDSEFSPTDESDISDSEYLTIEELSQCAKHVSKLLSRITTLQQSLQSTRSRPHLPKTRVHRLYRRFCRRFESDILAKAKADVSSLQPLPATHLPYKPPRQLGKIFRGPTTPVTRFTRRLSESAPQRPSQAPVFSSVNNPNGQMALLTDAGLASPEVASPTPPEEKDKEGFETSRSENQLPERRMQSTVASGGKSILRGLTPSPDRIHGVLHRPEAAKARQSDDETLTWNSDPYFDIFDVGNLLTAQNHIPPSLPQFPLVPPILRRHPTDPTRTGISSPRETAFSKPVLWLKPKSPHSEHSLETNDKQSQETVTLSNDTRLLPNKRPKPAEDPAKSQQTETKTQTSSERVPLGVHYKLSGLGGFPIIGNSQTQQDYAYPETLPRTGSGLLTDRAVKRKAGFKRRTKTGCITCRRRRLKCGEERPTCKNCVKAGLHCEGYNQRVVFKTPIGDSVHHPESLSTVEQNTSILPDAWEGRPPRDNHIPNPGGNLHSYYPSGFQDHMNQLEAEYEEGADDINYMDRGLTEDRLVSRPISPLSGSETQSHSREHVYLGTVPSEQQQGRPGARKRSREEDVTRNENDHVADPQASSPGKEASTGEDRQSAKRNKFSDESTHPAVPDGREAWTCEQCDSVVDPVRESRAVHLKRHENRKQAIANLVICTSCRESGSLCRERWHPDSNIRSTCIRCHDRGITCKYDPPKSSSKSPQRVDNFDREVRVSNPERPILPHYSYTQSTTPMRRTPRYPPAIPTGALPTIPQAPPSLYRTTVVMPRDSSERVGADGLFPVDYSAPEITDRDKERARLRKARADADKKWQEKADHEMAKAIQDEETKQVRFEIGRADTRAKERAEIQYAHHEKQRAEEREEARRIKQQEQKGRESKEREDFYSLNGNDGDDQSEIRVSTPKLPTDPMDINIKRFEAPLEDRYSSKEIQRMKSIRDTASMSKGGSRTKFGQGPPVVVNGDGEQEDDRDIVDVLLKRWTRAPNDGFYT